MERVSRCNWGIEIDRSCITVDFAGQKPQANRGLRPIIVTATDWRIHRFYQNPIATRSRTSPNHDGKGGPAGAMAMPMLRGSVAYGPDPTREEVNAERTEY
jgi:hypothetical protein